MSEEVKYLIGISVFLVVFVIPWVVLWRYYKKKPETKKENSFMRDFEARMMMAEMIAETKRQQYQKELSEKINAIIKQVRESGDNLYLVIEFAEVYAAQKDKQHKEGLKDLNPEEYRKKGIRHININWEWLDEERMRVEAAHQLAKRLREEFPNVIENYCGIKSVAKERERIRIKYTGIFKELR